MAAAMRTSLLLLSAAVAALTGCGPKWRDADEGSDRGPMRVVSTLQCPDHQGSLTRVGVAADGLSCDYAGPRGADVTLKLVKSSDQDAVLDQLDAQMNGLMPEVRNKVGDGPLPEPAAGSGSSAPSHDKVDINLPGFHVHTQGDRAQIRMPGVSIDADDSDGARGGSSHEGAAHVSVAGGLVDVRARNGAAIVRARGRRHGVRATYRLADETPSSAGWRLVGYEAHGPAGGPIVVAVVKSKDAQEDPVFHDADRLVRANVGG
jgi:hypothetical protein